MSRLNSMFINRHFNAFGFAALLRLQKTWIALLAVLPWLACQHGSIAGDDKEKRPYRIVEVWVSEVIGRGGRVDLVLGEAPTYSKAVKISQKWSKANPDDLRLTRERRVKKRVYPPVKDSPKPNSVEPLGNTKHPGSTGTSSRAALVQGNWSGKEGGSDVTFEFLPSGKVRAVDKYGVWSETWKMLTASSVFMELTSPNAIRYSGQITGNTIKGIARNVKNGRTWRFEISRAKQARQDSLVGTTWISLNEPGETILFALRQPAS